MDYRFEFDHFYIDTIERLLIRDGERITLKNKAIEVLLLLLKKSPAVVERESFMNEIWPDAFVAASRGGRNPASQEPSTPYASARPA